MDCLSEHDKAVLKTIFDPYQSYALSDQSSQDLQNANETEDERLDANTLELVKRAIRCAENNDFVECFRLFDEALKKTPESPTILNDRAQALRLAGRDKEALEDLHLAVRFSEGKGKAGIQALCQRGVLYKCMGMDQKAKEDFALAAKQGSEFAATQLVTLDPYANMGNEVLQEIKQKSN